METWHYNQFTQKNPYEELSMIHIKIQTELYQLKLEVSDKNNRINKLESEGAVATKYIERMEQKYVDSVDECVNIKAEIVSLKEKLNTMKLNLEN